MRGVYRVGGWVWCIGGCVCGFYRMGVCVVFIVWVWCMGGCVCGFYRVGVCVVFIGWVGCGCVCVM